MTGPLLEAVPMRYFKVTAGLAPQITAPTPFAAFHDLRWLFVFHGSWLMLAIESCALVGARSAFHAGAVRAAWPRDLAPPPWRVAGWHGLLFTAVSLVFLLPPATLVFAGGVTSLSWLAFAALPLLVIVALLLSHGGMTARWWAQLPTGRSLLWIAATFVELDLAAAAILLGPWWIAWLSAALSGLFNAWAWCGLTGALARRAPPRHPVPVTPLALVALFAVSIAVAAPQLAPIGRATGTVEALAAPTHLRGRIPVMIADGFDSRWSGETVPTSLDRRFVVWPFSYAGLRVDGLPGPYQPADTHESVGTLMTRMDVEVRSLAAATGHPVRLVGVSEGSLVARSYVEAFAHAPVSELVMISPLVEPGRAYYPATGHSGWGVGAGAAMHALASGLHAASGLDLDPEMPFLRSIVDHAPALRRGVLCPAPHVRIVALEPVAGDATIPPVGSGAQVPVRVVGGLHGAGVAVGIQYVATGRLPAASTADVVMNKIVRAAATAWTVPELPVTLNPQWTLPQFDARGCPRSGWPVPAPQPATVASHP